jgi:hypothetical protein
MNNTKRLSSKELSKNAVIVKSKLTKYNNKLISAVDMNKIVMNELNCSLRTAQRTLKELQLSKKLTAPKVYRVTLSN